MIDEADNGEHDDDADNADNGEHDDDADNGDHDMFCQLLTRLISWFSMSNSPFLLTYRWHGYLLSSILDSE